METWNAITSRKNVRDYADTPLPSEAVDRILEAARRAPSAMNRQWWDLVVVTDRDQLRALAGVWRGAGHVARSQATVAVVAPVPADNRQARMIEYDLGQMTMQLMIAAADLGIGTGHASVEDQELARELLGFPTGHRCAWLIALGYPADGPLRPIETLNRRPFDEVVHRGRF